ncbi:MAG: UDP-N-acetylmuramoyl-L-alanine--D-glutamate ligase [Alphaproteobacteria bacterium]
MIAVTTYRGRRVGVFGLGRTGLAAAKALAAGGADVIAWDDGEAGQTAGRAAGLTVARLNDDVLASCAALVLSPGVPLTHPAPHPLVLAAREKGCPVIGDMELFAQAVSDNAKIIAITGTNGKSTTTALIGHILAEAGLRTAVGGNIGHAVLDLPAPDDVDVYVLELSSYQIDLCQSFAADIAVLLNLTPDHLDRHGDMAGYVAAKARLFDMAPDGALAVLGVDSDSVTPIAAQLAQDGRLTLVPLSLNTRATHGVCTDGKVLIDLDDGGRRVMPFADAPRLPGDHNQQNIAAAYAVTKALAVSDQLIVSGIKSFPGLAHRLEYLCEIDGVRFVNDSKATNAEATRHALAAFDTIYWLAGGRAKTDGLAPLAGLMADVRGAYLFGEDAKRFRDEIGTQAPVALFDELQTATKAAFHAARTDKTASPVVLLSPAAASFDQYASFEARGDAFRAIVNELQETETGAAS